jgi:hypothetical protein
VLSPPQEGWKQPIQLTLRDGWQLRPNFEIHGQLHSCWSQTLQKERASCQWANLRKHAYQGPASHLCTGKWQRVLRHWEPFQCPLTITVTEKFRDLHPQMNTGRRAEDPTGTGWGPRALNSKHYLPWQDSRHHEGSILFTKPKKKCLGSHWIKPHRSLGCNKLTLGTSKLGPKAQRLLDLNRHRISWENKTQDAIHHARTP